MALVKTNQGFYSGTPGNSNISFNFNNLGGGDEFIMALVMFKNRTTAIPQPTYGGDAMNQFFQYDNNNFRVAVFGLLNPASGTNQFFQAASGQWNPASVIVTSFSGSSGFGVRNQNLTNAVNNTTTLSGLTTGSIIQGYGMSTNSTANARIQIPTGTTITREWRNNVSGWFWGATSPVLNVTSSTVRSYSGASWAQSRTGGIEIKESSSTPPTRRRRIIIN
ncbi:MAG: hypothetical protein Unbinned706contig1001_28 [Prokaryotic dsDNA virus sp.]|nr:MAG: hypothetical protein Unbinned706contig1001_28 [Prokaryotic dsDNA virus sp.]|tara:strand:- start:25355 stop:26017 length:663 start_codon:yes stop_codon:yes gene_type:complete